MGGDAPILFFKICDIIKYMKKIWMHKSNSFKEAAKFDSAYYMKMSKAERIGTMQLLREIYWKLKGSKDESGKRLRRVIKVI